MTRLALATLTGLMALACGCAGAPPTDLDDHVQVSSGGPTAAAACDGPRETEPNDTTANLLAGSVCGMVDPAGDTDRFTFTLAKGTRKLAFSFEGQVAITVRVGNKSVVITPTSQPAIPLVHDE